MSPGGTLAYVSGSVGWISRLVWRTLSGEETPLDLPAQPYGTFRISPDGRQIAFIEGGTTGDSVWIHDLQRRISRRLTRDGDDGYVVWTPDGLRVVFARQSATTSSLWWASVEGDAPPERLTADLAQPQRPYSVSPDGKQLAYIRGTDIWLLELFEARAARPFLESPHGESMPTFSPDGRWIAYTSNESGRVEVYVRPAAGGAGVQVSTNSGEEPVWAAGGRQLFYRNGSQWMATIVHPASGLSAEPPTLLFQGPYLNVPGHSYAVGRDGRFLLLRGAEAEADVTSIQIVLNWDEEVRRVVRTPGEP